MLVLVGSEDAIAPYEDTGAVLLREFPDRVQAQRIENAAHAFLPEAPHAINQAVLGFLEIKE